MLYFDILAYADIASMIYSVNGWQATSQASPIQQVYSTSGARSFTDTALAMGKFEDVARATLFVAL